jgi:hypothetical protein
MVRYLFGRLLGAFGGDFGVRHCGCLVNKRSMRESGDADILLVFDVKGKEREIRLLDMSNRSYSRRWKQTKLLCDDGVLS